MLRVNNDKAKPVERRGRKATGPRLLGRKLLADGLERENLLSGDVGASLYKETRVDSTLPKTNGRNLSSASSR